MNKKRFISVLLTLSMVLCLLPVVTLSAGAISTGITADYAWYTGGPSEADGFYHIGTPAGLEELANLVNFTDSEGSGQSAAVTFSGETIVLDSNIDLNSGVTFTFDTDTGLVAVTDGTDTFYLGTGVMGNADGGNTTFDVTASFAGTVYTDEAGTAGDAPFSLNTWVPIGGDGSAFSGTFDGGSHTVSGLYINASSLNDQGLFGYGEDSTIQNVNLDSGFICGANQVGGVAGYLNRGSVSGCTNSCTVIGCGEISGTTVLADLGGIVGSISDSGTVSNCRNTGVINSTALYTDPIGSIRTYIGGVVGNITRVGDVVVSDCTNTGSISTDGNKISRTVYAGGVVGYISGNGTPVSDCSNSGSITGLSSYRIYIGGVVGYAENGASLSNCTNTGILSGKSGIYSYVGGVVGFIVSSSVLGSCNTGSISSTSTFAYASGIAGSALVGSVTDCRNEGRVTSTGTADALSMAPPLVSPTNAAPYAGGIASFLSNGTISNCCNTGDISGAVADSDSIPGKAYIGGITGDNNGGTIINCGNTADITATCSATALRPAPIYIGGVVGANYKILLNCYNTGNVSDTGTNISAVYLGGVVGYNAKAQNCYSTGSVTGNATDAYVGSVAGYSFQLRDCYWLTGAAQTVNGTARTEDYAVGGYYYNSILQVAGTAGYTTNFPSTLIFDYYSFGGSGTAWTLSGGAYAITPVSSGSAISLEENAHLVDALNAWVDTGDYYMWASDSDSSPVNGGYPVLSVVYKPTLSGTTIVAMTNSDGESTDQIKIGTALTATANITPNTNLSYQWMVSSDGAVWANATGEGNNTTVYTACRTDSGKYLRVTVTSSDAYGAVYSEPSAQVPYVHTSSSTTTTPSPEVPIIVNGQSQNAGTSETVTINGTTETTITVDADKLDTILNSEEDGATVIIPFANDPDRATGILTGQMVKNMENQEATLVVQTDSASYTLPASEINIDSISEQFGTDIYLTDIKVTLSIAEPSANMAAVLEDASAEGGFTVQVPAVDFAISCAYNGQTVNVSSFRAYVEREIAIPAGVDAGKITTAVVVDQDGTTRHIPTKIVDKDGKYYAVINSRTNSTYAVVYNPVEFADAANHWAKDSINDMGSRMIVFGDKNGNYNPDKNITRAEFATIIVRALGLAAETGDTGFSDVAATDWYCGYIGTATEYGIATGYSDGNFGPNDTITREQAMTMIARAMTITKLNTDLTDGEIDKLLSTFSDRASASAYAKGSIAACLKTGITSGTSNTTISPKCEISRAEVAAMVERLLQKSNLI